MGACLSCFGSNEESEDGQRDRLNSERTPLLQDPSTILNQPQPEQILEDQVRDQAHLSKIVDRTSQNLIDIQSTFSKRALGAPGNDDEESQEDRLQQRKYLLERLQNNGKPNTPSPSGSETSGADKADATADSTPAKRYQPHPLETSSVPITSEEKKLLNVTAKMVTDAIANASKVKNVGQVVVKLSWD